MNPAIVNILYFVLGYLALSSGLQVHDLFENNPGNGYSSLYNASVSILILVLSLTAIGGLIKRQIWAKWVSFGLAALQGISTLSVGIYIWFLDAEMGKAILMTSVPIGLAFIFLAYKIYSSSPLRQHLANA